MVTFAHAVGVMIRIMPNAAASLFIRRSAFKMLANGYLCDSTIKIPSMLKWESAISWRRKNYANDRCFMVASAQDMYQLQFIFHIAPWVWAGITQRTWWTSRIMRDVRKTQNRQSILRPKNIKAGHFDIVGFRYLISPNRTPFPHFRTTSGGCSLRKNALSTESNRWLRTASPFARMTRKAAGPNPIRLANLKKPALTDGLF